jgi:hypothetical protein
VTTILVTVSRSWTSWSTTRAVLEETYTRLPDAVLMHGDEPRGDRRAAGIWRSLGGRDLPVPAKWSLCTSKCPPGHRKRRRNGEMFCPFAGLRRNRQMVETAPDLVLAFIDPKSRTKGASHCADYAEQAGIRVIRYRQGEDT